MVTVDIGKTSNRNQTSNLLRSTLLYLDSNLKKLETSYGLHFLGDSSVTKNAYNR